MTTLLRRLYKKPSDVDSSLLLDYLIVLAVSGRYYHEFDDKSVAFIDSALDLLDTRFTGMFDVTATRETNPKLNSENPDLTLQFFKPIHSPKRTYNKIKELTEPRNK